MYLAVMVGKCVKQVVREWCPSTTGPLLPTITDSVLAPGNDLGQQRRGGTEVMALGISCMMRY